MNTAFTKVETEEITDSDSYWAKLKQKEYPSTQQTADFGDVSRMLTRALSGLSAKSYNKQTCPIKVVTEEEFNGDLAEAITQEGVKTSELPKNKLPKFENSEGEEVENLYVVVYLEFYVFTSHDSLQYNLESNMGILRKEGVYSGVVSENVIFGVQESVDLEYRVKSLSSKWLSKVIKEDGTVIVNPSAPVVTNGRELNSGNGEIFGVADVKGESIGEKYILYIPISVPEGKKVTTFTPAVTVSWVDDGETKSEALSFTVPQCVFDSLTFCSDNSGQSDIVVINPEDSVSVYFSTCDGSVLSIVHAKGSQ